MEHIKRAERLGAMTRILTETPNRIHGFSEFCDLFGAAKSTVSEDIDIIASSIERFAEGKIETIAGASGGVRFRAIPSRKKVSKTLETLCQRLSEPWRALPGGFLYTSDISSESETTQAMGEILANEYYASNPDLVLTMETKGIPIAAAVARLMDVPLVIARRDSRAYEGSAVKINYIAGNNVDLETMALSRRAVKPGQKAVIIDDFMKGGGTLRGMSELMQEFQVEVVGIGVMVATAKSPAEKLGVRAILTLDGFDAETNVAQIRPSDYFKAYCE